MAKVPSSEGEKRVKAEREESMLGASCTLAFRPQRRCIVYTAHCNQIGPGSLVGEVSK